GERRRRAPLRLRQRIRRWGGLDGTQVHSFFFQAEDGIRDWSVTGVQTCALPIWEKARPEGTGSSPGTTRAAARPAGGPRRRCAEIGRASCRERGEIWVGAGLLKEKEEAGGACGV